MSSSDKSNGSGQRVDLADGRWVVLRPLRGADLVALANDDISATFTRLAAAVVEKSWDGEVLEEEIPVLREMIRGWRTRAEESAVPPGSGES